ncbi:MAG: DNA-directed RNA polymerase subunit alpha [Bacillales bacterium]
MAENEIKIAHPFQECNFKLLVDGTDDNYAKISADPLDKGFGITLGNALRRVLLSALPGSSVYAVEVEGAVHEFTALEGIEEDLPQIILNLKDLVLKSDTIGEAEYEIKVDVKGSKVLTAGDLECPTGLEVVNKDLVICNIVDGGHLKMRIYVRNGRGFATSEENKMYDLPVNVIATDSNYSPIERVNFKVEGTRVGHDSRYDKLILEVWTNGSISPVDAVALATKILINYLNNFLNLNASFNNLDLIKDPEEKEEDTFENLPIEDLDLSVRSSNCLKRTGITNVAELIEKTEAEMMKVRNLGKKSLKEVKEKLSSMGLSFKDSKED